MSLPSPWIEKIFAKLTLVYGRSFLDRWAGLEIDSVKADWAHELAGLQQSPQTIAYALQNLPTDKPPTVLEFRAICRRKPPEPFAALPDVKIDPERLAEHVTAVRRLMSKHAPGNKDWAHRIIAREATGGRIRPYTLSCAQEALGIKRIKGQA